VNYARGEKLVKSKKKRKKGDRRRKGRFFQPVENFLEENKANISTRNSPKSSSELKKTQQQ